MEKDKRSEIENLGVEDPVVAEYFEWREFWFKQLLETIKQNSEKKEGE